MTVWCKYLIERNLRMMVCARANQRLRFDDRTQPKANYFDFGQLGHGRGDRVASLLRVK